MRKSDEELLREAEALHASYLAAEFFDALHYEEPPEEWEDEDEILRSAGLNMGQP